RDHAVPAAALREAGWEGGPFATRQGAGCAACAGTGFRGRVAVYETMPLGEALRRRVVAGASALELRRPARAAGLRSLRPGRAALAARGATSLEEILRITPAD